jgi:hypothetical protein
MLSPAEWHKGVPKGRLNADYRLKLGNDCIGNKALQADVLQACKDDILFFINVWVIQFNPRSSGLGSAELGPFITWDFQDEALLSQDPEAPGILWCVDNKKDVVILKSREMGASWLCLLVIIWLFLFHPWKKILVISRSADAVDSPGDSDSLFWKIDFVLEHLPDWMRPPIKRRKFSFVNERNRSAVTGQASTGVAGVGGRAQLMFIDEFPVIKEDFEVLSKTASTAGSRIFNGTHNGTDTAFYKLSDPQSTAGSFIKRLYMHWTQHPDKRLGCYRVEAETNKVTPLDESYHYPPDFRHVTDGHPTGGYRPLVRSPWYDEQVKKIGETRKVAQELDMDAGGSMSRVFDAYTINHLIATYCCPPYWEGELHYDEDTGQPISFVPVKDGRIRLWCHLCNGRPKPAKYGAGSDVATGVGATPSCFSIFDSGTGEKVLAYANPHIRPDQYAVLCVALCQMFLDADGNPALFCWEMQGPGEMLGKKVIELGFRNIYFRTKEDTIEKQISSNPGWYPNRKPTEIRAYMAALYKGECVNRDEWAMKETLQYRYGPHGVIEHAGEESPEDPSGARINHGDRVTADFLAWKMCLALGTTRIMEKKSKEPPLLSLQWRRDYAARSVREDAWA